MIGQSELLDLCHGISDLYTEGDEAVWEALTFLGVHCELLEDGETAYEFYCEGLD